MCRLKGFPFLFFLQLGELGIVLIVRGSVRSVSFVAYFCLILRRDVMCTILGQLDSCIWTELTTRALEDGYREVFEVDKVNRIRVIRLVVHVKRLARLGCCVK